MGSRKANGQVVLGLAELSPNPAMGKAEKQNLQRLRAVGQVTVRQERQLAAVICLWQGTPREEGVAGALWPGGLHAQ